MLIGQPPESFLEAGRNGTFPGLLRAASAWADGASMNADWDGKVDTSENPFTDRVQASAWLTGAEEPRDIDGDVHWSACPYFN